MLNLAVPSLLSQLSLTAKSPCIAIFYVLGAVRMGGCWRSTELTVRGWGGGLVVTKRLAGRWRREELLAPTR